MARLNSKTTRPVARPAIRATGAPAVTHEGGAGFARDAKSDLFLLGTGRFYGEDSFYESAGKGTDRFVDLVRQIAAKDPVWVRDFVGWLRYQGNIRTGSLVAGIEAAKTLNELPQAEFLAFANGVLKRRGDAKGYPREVSRIPMGRADEPGEVLAYWSANYGRNFPAWLKRGVADAVVDLYNEYSYQKWDSSGKGWSFADVIRTVHPKPKDPRQEALFKYIIGKQLKAVDEPPETLPMLALNRWFRGHVQEHPESLLDAEVIHHAGMTWEDVLSLGGQYGLKKKDMWASVIPSMGYMALLRNLRNFTEAEVDQAILEQVAQRLADPRQVARSRQLPFRFWSAYNHARAGIWEKPLETALGLSMQNVPVLDGATLILIDTSSSMTDVSHSSKSKVRPVDQASLFALSLAAKNAGRVQVYGFANGISPYPFPVQKGASVLREMERFAGTIGQDGHGTNIAESIRRTYKAQHRIFIFSDGQTMDDRMAHWHGSGTVSDAAPANIPMYGFNVSGHAPAAIPSGKGLRYEMGGLTDATFRQIPLMEAAVSGNWPWEKEATVGQKIAEASDFELSGS